jgi:hypothetical protein
MESEAQPDGNWDDGFMEEDELGFAQGSATQIGGVADMEDEVHLEFEEDEEEATPIMPPSEPKTWKLLARYMANFKPNTKTMFKRFSEDVWCLRNGIRYYERGKNYFMITLFSEGDYDFVMRGGPWIFRQHALVVKDFTVASRPSEAVLDSVPVWVRIYDVPWEKQNKLWGMRYGNGLGKAVEVDVPSDVQDMNEFLRVRVELPYNRRIQPQLSTGVKGKPGSKMVFKLKYERIPYYCSHCGFMGHKKDDCEKERRGIPSLDYEVYQLRCSPYKKFEHRAHFVPPTSRASAKKGLSFSSFGSAESHKPHRQNREHTPHQRSQQQGSGARDVSPNGSDDMPPLEDDIPGYGDVPGFNEGLVPVGIHDGFDETEHAAMEEVD